MTIRVSTSSGVPIYLQIMKQIEQMVATGRLVAGEELPPIRTLAQELGPPSKTAPRPCDRP